MKKTNILVASLFIFGFAINDVNASTIEARISYGSENFTINLNETNTIADLKEKIEDEKGLEVSLQRISNDSTNTEYNDDLIISTSNFCLIGNPNNYIEIKLEKIINEETVVNFKSIKPTTEKEFNYIDINLRNEDIYIINGSCNSTHTKCKAKQNNGTNYYNNLVINYVYDSNNKNVIDNILSNLPSNKNRFDIRDMEVINYWYKGGNVSYYSSELMNYINYKNFNIEFYAGDNQLLNSHMIGMAAFKYDGVAYYMSDDFGYNMSHVLYVPSNTSTSEYLTTIKDRIDKIIGKNKYTLIDSGNIDTFIDNYIDEYYDLDDLYNNYLDNLNPGDSPMSKSQYKNDLKNSIKDENTNEISLSSDNHIYTLTIENETHYFVICADTSKMVDVEYKTSDIITDITVSSISTSVYNDATIKVNKITTGDEYNRIINVLDVEDGEMFDIKLYSSSKDKYVTELSDGTFEVKIPVPEKYNGKELIVYYVDENNNVEEHEVTISNGYAIFTTTHFSIYTLSVKTELVNPQTGDNIITNIIFMLLSIITVIFIFNKKDLIKNIL